MRVTANGIDIACEAAGPQDAPVLVFNHSLATSRAMWRAQVAAFAPRYRVVTFDMRGHGESAAPDFPYTLDMLADDVVGVLDCLGVERPAVFVGISIGGMIGQSLGLRHAQRFRALVLASTTSRVPPEGRAMWDQRIEAIRRDGVEGQVQPTLERWLSAEFRARDPETTRWVADMIRGTPAAGMIGCGHAIKMLDYTEQLQRIALPTLIIAGEKDPGTPVAASEAIQARIKGSRLEVIPGCLHQAPIEAPGAFNRILADFLADLR
ncbi:MAG: alpha/beta fold hydrolase [Rhodospirillaceae bacterium]|nr:alpha/beta fold hydrolase [Rhodospirillaceae bacterium]